jgi:hypothetical protein
MGKTDADERRWFMKKIVILGLALAAAAGVLFAAQERVPGQKPLVVVEGAFQFLPGSWARYNVLDKVRRETYSLSLAVLERKIIDGRACSWLEIEVRMKDQPRVVTRVLAEETGEGPGEIRSAVVQVEGSDPFSVPKGCLKPESKSGRVAPVQAAEITRRLERTAVCLRGRTISAWRVEARTEDGRELKATVSKELPPIGVYDIESPELRMTADDWGMGARSEVKGTPLPFWLWLLDQVARGMDEGKRAS